MQTAQSPRFELDDLLKAIAYVCIGLQQVLSTFNLLHLHALQAAKSGVGSSMLDVEPSMLHLTA